jgi:hypothetical protein
MSKVVAGKIVDALPYAKSSNLLLVELTHQHYVLGCTSGQITERVLLDYSTLVGSLKRLDTIRDSYLKKLKELYR